MLCLRTIIHNVNCILVPFFLGLRGVSITQGGSGCRPLVVEVLCGYDRRFLPEKKKRKAHDSKFAVEMVVF